MNRRQNNDQDRPPTRTGSGTGDISASLDSLRSILTNSDGHTTDQQNAALATIDRERNIRESEVRERALHQTLANEGLFEAQDGTSPTPASIVRSRRQLFRSQHRINRLERQRSRMDRLARQDPVEQLSTNTSRLSPLPTTRARQAPSSHEAEPPLRRHSKRRKLEDGSSHDYHLLPEYGLEGTLLPGNLSMKVLDSSIHDDPNSQADEGAKLNLYRADNKNIFRSRKHKCTILMKHQGGWPFALSKLVIKIPRHDYDSAPLQGMVFVSMENDGLLDRTATYDNLFPAAYVQHRARRYDSYRPSHEYMHSTRSPIRSVRPRTPPDPNDSHWCDPAISFDESLDLPTAPGITSTVDRLPAEAAPEDSQASPRSPRPWHEQAYDTTSLIRRYARSPYADTYRPSYTDARERDRRIEDSTRRWRTAATAAATAADAADAEAEENLTDNESPTNSESEGDEEREGQEHDHDEEEEEDAPPLYRGIPASSRDLEEASQRQQDILTRMRARRERNSSEYNGTGLPPGHPWDTFDFDDPASRSLPPYTSTKRLPGCNEMLQGRRPSSSLMSDPEVPAPHATFQIPFTPSRDRVAGCDGVTIHFEPEVSGKYILVKLWTQCPNLSVALQGIVPYGFAGLRQVADLEFR